MRTWVTICLVSLLAVGLACSDIRVKHNYDKKINFEALKTYSWLKLPPTAGDVRSAIMRNDLLDKRIRSMVNTQLSAKGYKQVESGGDFMIVYHTGLNDKVRVSEWGYSYGPYWEWPGRNIGVYTYTEGTLILDFIDSNKELIWRGTASGTVDPQVREKNNERLDEAISKLLTKFPPQ